MDAGTIDIKHSMQCYIITGKTVSHLTWAVFTVPTLLLNHWITNLLLN